MAPLKHQALKLGIWYARGGSSTDVPAHICPATKLATADKQLETLGYVTDQQTLAGRSVAVESKCTELTENRTLRKYRRDEVALRILDWVDEFPDNGKAIHQLADSRGFDFTGDFTSDEFKQIGKQLYDDGFLKGIRANGKVVMRTRLTSKGEQCLHSGYAPNDFESNRGSSVNNYEANISGNVGGLQQGDHNVMKVKQVNEVDRLLGEMRNLIPADAPEAQEQMEAIEAQVKTAPGRIAPLKALVSALATAVGTGAGQQITGLGEKLVQLLQQG